MTPSQLVPNDSGRVVAPVMRHLALVTLLFADAAPVLAQPSAAPPVSPDDSHARAAVARLREGDVKSAFEALGAAVDQRGGAWNDRDPALASAAGAAFRSLAQLSADEQMDLLLPWSLPSDSRKSVRILTSAVPRDAPPKEFARLLGERPRDQSFPISEINGVPGLFCSGWTLVRAAEENGRLSRLLADLEPLARDGVPHAATLLTLARIADRRTGDAEVQTVFQQRIAAVRDRQKQPGAAAPDGDDLPLAVAALSRQNLQVHSVELLSALLQSVRPEQTPRLCALLRRAHAVAVQLHRGQSGPETLTRQRLKYWVPVTGGDSRDHASGGPAGLWLVHEEHILHLAGTGNDVLFCRFPLIGEFEFHCETQKGGAQGTDGGLTYGGLNFLTPDAPGQLEVLDADFQASFRRSSNFIRRENLPVFNQQSFRSSPEEVLFLMNLHPAWFDRTAALQSPWLGLRSTGGKRPLFRNLAITGKPVIPREVRLAQGNELRGWQAAFFGRTQPPFVPLSRPADREQLPHPVVVPDPDWRMEQGVIRSERRQPLPVTERQNLLRYQRPLLAGDSVTYEFQYVPGERGCHPALGRLAFLLEPGGIRVHWMTDGDYEWSGLTPDNATLEPLNRRGPRPLPLKENEWNQVELKLVDDKLNILLNGQLVYVRPTDISGNPCFGIYHDRSATTAEVRNVLLRGDWPETLPDDFLQNPAVLAEDVNTAAGRRVRQHFLGREPAANVVAVIRRAAGLPPQERYRYLSDWVLPGDQHDDFRLAAMFTQTQPSPLARQTSPALQRTVEGAELISPALDLLDLAAELNQVDALHERASALPVPADELGQRARLALLTLLALARGQQQAADKLFAELQPLVEKSRPLVWEDVWPETVLIFRAMDRFPNQPGVQDLLQLLVNSRVLRLVPPGSDGNQAQVAVLAALHQHLQAGGSREAFYAPSRFRDWIPAGRERARSRGLGYPVARWRLHETLGLEHLAGHQEEYLLYRTPLRGDFEVNGDVYGYGATQMLIGGQFWGPRGEVDKIATGTFRQGATAVPLDPPSGKLDAWVPFRAVSRGDKLEVSLFGRVIHRTQLDKHEDPWLGMHCWWRHVGRIRNVHIQGPQEVRPTVVLSADPSLIDWLPYFDEDVGRAGGRWWWEDCGADPGEIHGASRDDSPGAFHQSLLRYKRPFVENGTIEYDFWYEPGSSMTHPALDRLAFLLEPAGVRIHWITDAQYDPTGVRPDNATVEPENRRGDGALPLKVSEWNHLALLFQDDRVALKLNGQLIYERDLEPENLRTFGLFHYADQTAVRVRNALMTGDWPGHAPPLVQQELADRKVLQLDAERDAMTGVFQHDFVADGLPDELFQVVGRVSPGSIQPVPRQGLRQQAVSDSTWASVVNSPRFSVAGDFDFEAALGDIDFEHCQGQSEMSLLIHLADGKEFRMGRARRATGEPFLKSQLSLVFPDGGRNYDDKLAYDESNWGRVRVARRGKQVYLLFAQTDSPRFRIIGEWTASDSDVPIDGIRLIVSVSKPGYASGFWKNITLRANRLLYFSPSVQPRRALFILNSDGSNPRKVVEPLAGLSQLGSPEWSADGRQLALDMSTGPTTTSRIVLVNADGTNVRNLAPGCMPSFSADGKRLAASVAGRGIVVIDADGANSQVIDDSGWGVQWSPDGKVLAYGRGGNVILYDVASSRRRELLSGADAQRFAYVYWNLAWSHDSRALAFKGRRADGKADELCVAEVNPGAGLKTLVSPADAIGADVGWTPDDRFISFCKFHLPSGGAQLHLVRRDGATPPQLFVADTKVYQIGGASWSHDGKYVAFTADEKPQPVEWPVPSANPASGRSD